MGDPDDVRMVSAFCLTTGTAFSTRLFALALALQKLCESVR